MNLLLETIWDFVCTVSLWVAFFVAFIFGLFLLGLTFKFLGNVFMAGYYLL
jgi:hypothetical protein